MENTLHAVLMLILLCPVALQAGVRDAGSGNARVVMKLQGMVRQISAERDQLITENTKLHTALATMEKDKKKAVHQGKKLTAKLTRQSQVTQQLKRRLEQTHAKLLEVIDKYKVLNKTKRKLTQEFSDLQYLQQNTVHELSSCSEKNHKLYSLAKDVLNHYENKGVLESLLQSEAFLQFQSVEMENQAQDFEDKLRAQKYQDKPELLKKLAN